MSGIAQTFSTFNTTLRNLNRTYYLLDTGLRRLNVMKHFSINDSLIKADSILNASFVAGSVGTLDATLTLGNISDLPIKIDNPTFAFYSLLNHYGITTTHNPVGFIDEYPVTFLGWESSTPVLKIRDAFGYFGYIKAGTLTGTRKIRIPDEGAGTDWKSDIVIHETNVPTHVNQYAYGRTETGGGYTIWKDTATGKIAKITTYGGVPSLSLQDASSSGYTVLQSGSVSGTKYIASPNASGTMALINDTVGGSGANPVLLTAHSSSASPGNFATADLTFTGNRYHNVDRYNVDIDSANMFVIQDTSGNYALNINDTANYGNSLMYVSSRTDKTLRMSPSTSYLSRLFLQANASQNLCQLFAGNNKISFTETSSLCNISFLSGSANPAILVIDSVTRSIQINHLTGSGTISSVAGGTGAGTAPTITMGSGSTDLNGYINVTTGTGCATDATVATITFALPYATAPKTILLSPANKATQNLAIGQQCFVNQAGIATTTFAITSNGTALADATAYKWYYFIVQ